MWCHVSKRTDADIEAPRDGSCELYMVSWSSNMLTFDQLCDKPYCSSDPTLPA